MILEVTMFLMKLNNREKFAFLEIAYYIAHIDGKIQIEEKKIIEEYCVEMGIDNIELHLEDIDFKEALKEFKSLESQKVLLLESMILVHSDDKYVNSENEVIKEIVDYFGFSKTITQIYSKWGKMASGLFSQGNLFIDDSNLK